MDIDREERMKRVRIARSVQQVDDFQINSDDSAIMKCFGCGSEEVILNIIGSNAVQQPCCAECLGYCKNIDCGEIRMIWVLDANGGYCMNCAINSNVGS